MQSYIWSPWSIFDELERSMFAAGSSEWPQFDIEDTEDETVLSADLPGVTEDDVDVTVSGAYLVVRGERKAKEGRYVRRARVHGAFERRFWIGEGYDPDQITAHIANGELTIRLGKAARTKPRRIKLTSGGIAAKVKGLLGGDKDKQQAA
jgi:HSP20 family protein